MGGKQYRRLIIVIAIPPAPRLVAACARVLVVPQE